MSGPSLADLLGEGYEPLLNAHSREPIAHYGFPPDAPWLLDLGKAPDLRRARSHFYLTPDCLGFIYDKYAIIPARRRGLRWRQDQRGR